MHQCVCVPVFDRASSPQFQRLSHPDVQLFTSNPCVVENLFDFICVRHVDKTSRDKAAMAVVVESSCEFLL